MVCLESLLCSIMTGRRKNVGSSTWMSRIGNVCGYIEAVRLILLFLAAKPLSSFILLFTSILFLV